MQGRHQSGIGYLSQSHPPFLLTHRSPAFRHAVFSSSLQSVNPQANGTGPVGKGPVEGTIETLLGVMAPRIGSANVMMKAATAEVVKTFIFDWEYLMRTVIICWLSVTK